MCLTDEHALSWKKSIEETKEKYNAGLTDPDIRFASFAPMRPNSLAHW